MSRLWIAVDAKIRDNAKVWEFASALLLGPAESTGSSTDGPRTYPYDVQRKALAEAVGYLIQLWGEVADNRPNGDLSRVPDPLMEQWAGWPGEPGRFAYYFKSIFVNDALINDWEEHNGRLLAMRERERQRGERRRSAKTSTGSSTGSSTGQSVDRPAANLNLNPNLLTTVPAPAGAVVVKPVRTRTARVTGDRREAPAVPWVAEAFDLWKANIGYVAAGYLGKELKPLVTDHGWPKVRRALLSFFRFKPYRRANGKHEPMDGTGTRDLTYCTPREFSRTFTEWLGGDALFDQQAGA